MTMREAIGRCLVLALLIGMCGVDIATAQGSKTVTIPDDVACKGCVLERRHVVRLGRATDSVLLGRLSVVAPSPRGYFVVAPTATLWQAAVYDSSGALVRTLGRRGQGPGEFTRIYRPIIGSGDTVFVHETDGRYHVYAPDLRFIETRRLPARPMKILTLPDGQSVVGADIGSALGYPLHLVSNEGALVRSFGTTNAVYRADRSVDRARQIGPASGDHMIWSGLTTRYEIELWNVRGARPDLVIRRTAPWVEPWREPEGLFNTHRPPTQLVNVRELPAGKLWTRLIVAAKSWAPDPSLGPSATNTVGVRDRFMDSVIEVLDVRTLRVLARQRFDEAFLIFIPYSELVYSLTETDEGFVFADLWRLSLRTP